MLGGPWHRRTLHGQPTRVHQRARASGNRRPLIARPSRCSPPRDSRLPASRSAPASDRSLVDVIRIGLTGKTSTALILPKLLSGDIMALSTSACSRVRAGMLITAAALAMAGGARAVENEREVDLSPQTQQTS